MRAYCERCRQNEVAYNGLCQVCINKDKRGGTQKITAVAREWTSKDVRGQFGTACRQIADKTYGGYYLVNGADGMHVHVYSGEGAHVKIGNDKFTFINVKGKFVPSEWAGGVDAVMRRATGETQANLLAAMALVLAELGGLSAVEAGKLISALGVLKGPE